MSRPEGSTVAAWLAAALVFGGATTVLVALTVDGAGLPRGAGGAWARATFTAPSAPSTSDAGVSSGSRRTQEPGATMVVALTVRGEVVVVAGADDDLRQDFEAAGGATGPRVDGAAAVAGAMPQSTTILAVYVAAGLMVAAVAAGVLRRRVQALWPVIAAAALALLVVTVLLRHLAVGALASWTTAMNLAEVDTHATSLSGRPVAGAAIALAGALVGTVAAGSGPRAADRP